MTVTSPTARARGRHRSNAPWLNLSPASGSGAGSFNVQVEAGLVSGRPACWRRSLDDHRAGRGELAADRAGEVARLRCGARRTPRPDRHAGDNVDGRRRRHSGHRLGARRHRHHAGHALARPAAGRTGVLGDGKVSSATPSPVDGARPDVEAAYAMPYDYQAGWGYLLLTNMLPNQGNGTFRLHVYRGRRRRPHDAARLAHDHLRQRARDQAVRLDRYAGPGRHGLGQRLRELRLGADAAAERRSRPTARRSRLHRRRAGRPPGYNQLAQSTSRRCSRAAPTRNGAVGLLQFDTNTLSQRRPHDRVGRDRQRGQRRGHRQPLLHGAQRPRRLRRCRRRRSRRQRSPRARTHRRSGGAGGGRVRGQPVSPLLEVPASLQPASSQKGFAPVRRWTSSTTRCGRRPRDDRGARPDARHHRFAGVGRPGRLRRLPGRGAAARRRCRRDRSSTSGPGEFYWQPGPGFVGIATTSCSFAAERREDADSLTRGHRPAEARNEVLLPSRGIRVIK